MGDIMALLGYTAGIVLLALGAFCAGISVGMLITRERREAKNEEV